MVCRRRPHPRRARAAASRKTLCFGHRLFTGNDQESTGIARFLYEGRGSQTSCDTMKTSNNWNSQYPRVGNPLVAGSGTSSAPATRPISQPPNSLRQYRRALRQAVHRTAVQTAVSPSGQSFFQPGSHRVQARTLHADDIVEGRADVAMPGQESFVSLRVAVPLVGEVLLFVGCEHRVHRHHAPSHQQAMCAVHYTIRCTSVRG
jgi:hypothetical protein